MKVPRGEEAAHHFGLALVAAGALHLVGAGVGRLQERLAGPARRLALELGQAGREVEQALGSVLGIWPFQEPTGYYVPTGGQVAAALGLAVVGFLLTLAIDRLGRTMSR